MDEWISLAVRLIDAEAIAKGATPRFIARQWLNLPLTIDLAFPGNENLTDKTEEYHQLSSRVAKAGARALQLEFDELRARVAADRARGKMAPFRDMRSLAWEEVAINVLEGNRYEVSARGVRVIAAASELDLVDSRRGEARLNKLGVILLAICLRKPVKERLGKKPKIKMLVSRLRAQLQTRMGIEQDPFTREWQPRFQLHDRRDAGDKRAKRAAEYRTRHLSSAQRAALRDAQVDDRFGLFGEADSPEKLLVKREEEEEEEWALQEQSDRNRKDHDKGSAWIEAAEKALKNKIREG